MNIYDKYLKRAIDVVVALVGLIVLLPVMVAIALLIKREDKGEVLYRGIRVGKDGATFKMLKFRTMVMNAERIGGSSTPLDDPRITRTGLFLRRYKLDELPQLLNVFQGNMSLVGPRPQVPWAIDIEDPVDLVILSVKPGLTDYASVEFHDEGELLRGSSNPDKTYLELIHPEKKRLAREYVESLSLKTDLKIIGMTFLTILKKLGGNNEY